MKLSAAEVVEKYNNKYKKAVAEELKSLSQTDLNAKASAESLIENKFSIDNATQVDAVNEMMKLAESNSFIANKMMEIFDNVSSNCRIDESGNIYLNKEGLKSNY